MKLRSLVGCIVFIAAVAFPYGSANAQVVGAVKEAESLSLSENSKTVNSNQGFVYTESNDAGQNAILTYAQSSNGKLTFLRSTPSGGSGSGAPLGSQGALAFDDVQVHWLFAVNAGSNSISSFSVDDNGG